MAHAHLPLDPQLPDALHERRGHVEEELLLAHHGEGAPELPPQTERVEARHRVDADLDGVDVGAAGLQFRRRLTGQIRPQRRAARRKVVDRRVAGALPGQLVRVVPLVVGAAEVEDAEKQHQEDRQNQRRVRNEPDFRRFR